MRHIPNIEAVQKKTKTNTALQRENDRKTGREGEMEGLRERDREMGGAAVMSINVISSFKFLGSSYYTLCSWIP